MGCGVILKLIWTGISEEHEEEQPSDIVEEILAVPTSSIYLSAIFWVFWKLQTFGRQWKAFGKYINM